MFKIFGRGPRVKYSSAETRSTSLDMFAGDAMINEPQKGVEILPIDGGENLMLKFRSAACRYDLPSANGVQVVKKKLGGVFFDLGGELDAWVRNKGERPK